MTSTNIKPVPDELRDPLRRAADYHRSGRFAEAEFIYSKAAEVAPEHEIILGTWGTVLLEMRKTNEAIEVFERALAVAPDYVLVLVSMAKACNKLGRFEQSLAYGSRALELAPDHGDAYILMGDTLRLLDRTQEARGYYVSALEMMPDSASAAVGIAYSDFVLGEHEAGVAHLRAALEKHPDSMVGQWSLSQFLLLLGQYKEGWERFHWRWEFGDTPPPEKYVGRPVWDGASLAGKTLLIWNEQGLGDELLFSTCLPDLLADARPARVYLATDARLIPIYGRTFPDLDFLPMGKASGSGWQVTLPEFDIQVAAGDLPKFYRLSVEDFPADPVRFVPDPEKADMWRARLDALGPDLKVGVAWRGGIEGIFGRKKSANLETLLPILQVPGVTFVNVQYGDCRDDLADMEARHGIRIHDWDDLDAIADPDSQMAQISCLDLVVQSSNASAHMAGVLGVPVWNMVPFLPDWRWSLTGERCLWYRSMRIFRQTEPGNWDSVVARAADELRALADPRKG